MNEQKPAHASSTPGGPPLLASPVVAAPLVAAPLVAAPLVAASLVVAPLVAAPLVGDTPPVVEVAAPLSLADAPVLALSFGPQPATDNTSNHELRRHILLRMPACQRER